MNRESTNKAQEHLAILKQHNYLSSEIWKDYEGAIWFANWVIMPDGSVLEPAMVTFEWERLVEFQQKTLHTEDEIKRAHKDLAILEALREAWHKDSPNSRYDEFRKAIEHAEDMCRACDHSG